MVQDGVRKEFSAISRPSEMISGCSSWPSPAGRCRSRLMFMCRSKEGDEDNAQEGDEHRFSDSRNMAHFPQPEVTDDLEALPTTPQQQSDTNWARGERELEDGSPLLWRQEAAQSSLRCCMAPTQDRQGPSLEHSHNGAAAPKYDPMADWCTMPCLLKAAAGVGVLLGSVVLFWSALAASLANTATLGLPESRRAPASSHVPPQDANVRRQALLGSLDSMCLFPPCASSKDRRSTWVGAEADAMASRIRSPAFQVPMITSTPPPIQDTAYPTASASGRWVLIGRNATCSPTVSKTLAGFDTSPSQCKALTLADEDCGTQMYVSEFMCRCVLAKSSCDFQPGISGDNVYEWREHNRQQKSTVFMPWPQDAPTETTTTALSQSLASHAATTTAQLHKEDPHSLFCFMLVVPWGEEPKLVRWQHDAKKGIFQCDHYAVYSNTTDIGVKGLSVKVVRTDLDCKLGGKWLTRLNTPIFIKLWDQVVLDGQYSLAGWTVKLDADSVFFPQRLRELVATPSHRTAQDSNGIFSDNCGYRHDLHGPIELLSRTALETWAIGHVKICDQPPQEDVYLRKCLLSLGVRKVPDYTLLAEEYCYWDWKSCQSSRVVFHPFKKLQGQWDCYAQAEKYGNWSLLQNDTRKSPEDKMELRQ